MNLYWPYVIYCIYEGCGRRREVGPKNWWAVGFKMWEMGGLPPKKVENGKLAPNIVGRWEVETPAIPLQRIISTFHHYL